ncbi:MAG: CRISPR-associated helicase Cas3' [Cytophagales bacterium]|nr:MAG: CRISPR-associated helicase Cas3' [Cytophagales bacterium]
MNFQTMKLYNSFEKLISEFPPISDFIKNCEDYLAHTPKLKGQDAEKLIEHIEKVNQYALKLSKIHSLDKVVDKLIFDMIALQPEFANQNSLGNYIKGLFMRSIIFHDYGKVNPNFQQKKMENPLFKWDNTIKIDSQHSKLSAYIFIHYHLKEVDESVFNEAEQSFLWALVFLFSNPILKHHASYIEHDIRFEKDVFNSLNGFLNDFKADFADAWDYFQALEKKSDGEGLLDCFAQYYPTDNYFPVFVLLKLSFSLLTASDYYATFDYTSGNNTQDLILKDSDFGLIDKNLKDRITYNFSERDFFDAEKKKRNYNYDMFQSYETYKNMSFSTLQEQNNQNLNHLRQKLTVEVIENLRQNYQNNLFYLEAPTGAGKTNLSLALAIEMMQLDNSINKIFYVFPFNTLISQTFNAVKETLGLTNNDIVQLNSKSGFHEKDSSEEKDALYGKNKLNFIDNLFINYPITLFSHIKFFDILKANSKETNYILHRLTNAVVIIDELQSYNPKHWDKVIFFLANYAKYFNLKIVLMSATLPKIDDLDETAKGTITRLVTNKNEYFTNPNFKGRVQFDFTLLGDNWRKLNRQTYLEKLKNFLFEKAEERANKNGDKSNIIIEFIKKKSAGEFFRLIENDTHFKDYKLFLVSGEILEPRRKEIIDAIKAKTYPKVLLISTQVVEAGVDIDMDLGFKDKSLIDSDEQLAGRVNRNASKKDCKVYIFNLDREADIYGKDERYKKTRDEIDTKMYQNILETKDFDLLYEKVTQKTKQKNANEYEVGNLMDYKKYLENFKFYEAHKNFRLIEEANSSIFVPLFIPANHFSEEDKKTFNYFNIQTDIEDNINGKDIWNKYTELVEFSQKRTRDYITNQTEMKKLAGIMSKFTFSVYEKQAKSLREFCNQDYEEKYGIMYLLRWEQIYSYEGGLDIDKLDSDVLL